jgi:hypothetical protein
MRRIKSRLQIALILLGLTLVIVLGARQKFPTNSHCRAPYVAQSDLATRLWDRLKTTKEGADLVLRLPSPPSVCFGQVEFSVVTTEGIILLNDQATDGENAAKLAHLMLHFAEGNPLEKADGGDCDERVRNALRREARAFALELRLRRDLGVTRKAYEFEDEFWTIQDKEKQIFVLFDYLQKHPDGAPGIDALGTSYAKRCREEEMNRSGH